MFGCDLYSKWTSEAIFLENIINLKYNMIILRIFVITKCIEMNFSGYMNEFMTSTNFAHGSHGRLIKICNFIGIHVVGWYSVSNFNVHNKWVEYVQLINKLKGSFDHQNKRDQICSTNPPTKTFYPHEVNSGEGGGGGWSSTHPAIHLFIHSCLLSNTQYWYGIK